MTRGKACNVERNRKYNVVFDTLSWPSLASRPLKSSFEYAACKGNGFGDEFELSEGLSGYPCGMCKCGK